MRFLTLLWSALLVVCLVSCAGMSGHRVVQQGARDGTTRSVTFLSSGYTDNESDRFRRDVDTCVRALHNQSDGVNAEPWNRYASLLNIYAVFQPSAASGAGNSSGEGNHSNNLGCTLSRVDPLVVNCNFSAIFSLATAAPTRDLVVVLVNEPKIRRASGGNSLAIFTNDDTFLPFFAVRELSKAIAHLADEYTRGVLETKRVDIPNCAASVEEALKKWGYWINKGLASKTPPKGCFFNNYYRPTANDCMMRSSSVNSMCAICKEQVNAALVRSSGFSLASARCPREGHKVNVNNAGDLQLSVGGIEKQPGVVVTWRHANGSVISTGDLKHLEVSSTSLNQWAMPTSITSDITDNSPYVRPEWHTINSTTTFSLVNDTSSCSATKCASFDICTSCEGKDCAVTVLPNPRKVRWAVDKGMVENNFFDAIIGFVLIACALLVFFMLILIYFNCYYNRPHEVLLFTSLDEAARVLALFCAVVIVSLTIFALMWIERHFDLPTIMWQELLIPSILVLLTVFLVALMNFGAVLFYCHTLMIICAIILFIIGLAFFGVGAFFLATQLTGNKTALTSYVAQRWAVATETKPDAVDRIQSHLNCSGFFAHCLQVNASVCPANSESNLYADFCEVPFMELIETSYIPGGAFTVVLGIFLLLLALLDIFLAMRCLNLSKMGRRRRMHHKDPNPQEVPLTFTEARVARRIFHAVADKPNQTLRGKAASSFLEKIFNIQVEPDIKEYIERSGPLTYDELMLIYFPHFVTTRSDPRQLAFDEVHTMDTVVDVQKLQFQRLCEFAATSDTLSPETLHELFEQRMSHCFIVDSGEFLALIKREAKSGRPKDPQRSALTPLELEGLRGLWVALRPGVVGSLSDAQIDLLYQWLHGECLRDAQHFRKWKRSLDVSGRGKVGWEEFCHLFERNALLCRARDALRRSDKEVPPEMISRSFVEERFREQAEELLLKHETEVPIERIIKHLLSML